MSFIVSYNGQFKPYKLPDLTYFDRLHSVNKSEKGKSVESHEDHSIAEEKSRKTIVNTNRSKISTYAKVDKDHIKQKKTYFASDLMSKNPRCLYTSDNLATVLECMKKYNYRHFPIMSAEERLVGIISDRDILIHLHKDHKKILIKDIMSKEVLTAIEDTRIQDISKIMLHEKINSLPIISDQHVLVGIITQSDILSYVTKSNPIDLWV
jgi:CBS domain-containing protein